MVFFEHPSEDRDHLAGGDGHAKAQPWIPDKDLPPSVNMICTLALEPGGSVGDHRHEGESEIYRIISGKGLYNDNGLETEVKAGDVTVCYAGQTHGMKNSGQQALVFDAIIVAG